VQRKLHLPSAAMEHSTQTALTKKLVLVKTAALVRFGKT
jgi:hypothetical protein